MRTIDLAHDIINGKIKGRQRVAHNLFAMVEQAETLDVTLHAKRGKVYPSTVRMLKADLQSLQYHCQSEKRFSDSLWRGRFLLTDAKSTR